MNNNFYNLKIGLIGGGSQFDRISKILRQMGLNYFKYKPEGPDYFHQYNFLKLTECNPIFILSPNNTHFDYIEKFYRDKYIFCEKPPVSTLSQIEKLKKLPHNKIFFNYNWRYSNFKKALSSFSKKDIGRLVYGNIITGHGLALKKHYEQSWRSNYNKCPKGVFEIVSIHWIDLVNYIFKIKKIDNPRLFNFSNKGTSFDNSYSRLILEQGQEINIFTSYTTPLVNQKIFIFTNGIIEQTSKFIEIRGPALNFDENGFFKKPKLLDKISISEDEDYNLSLKESVIFFLNKVSNKREFEKKDFDCSIKSNKLML